MSATEDFAGRMERGAAQAEAAPAAGALDFRHWQDGDDPYAATACLLDADGRYGEYFIHRVGHGIGQTTHEPPYMIEGETRPIEPGMCFSIEPGIYLPGRFGVRIEDIVVATEDGGRRLNNTSREMRIVA